MKIVKFNDGSLQPIKLVHGGGGEWVYLAFAEEFVLSKICIEEGKAFYGFKNRNEKILIIIEGESVITDFGNSDRLHLHGGAYVLVPAAVSQYLITGNGKIYKASVSKE